MAEHTPAQMGFTLWVLARPGLSPGEEAAFTRRLEDYMAEHSLLMLGGPLCCVVWSAERSLTASDQVDLIDWLTSDMAPVVVCVSPLSDDLDRPALREAGCVRADSADAALIPLIWLYQLRRITADLFLQILGGFVQPVDAH